jgi:hypothetical protein
MKFKGAIFGSDKKGEITKYGEGVVELLAPGHPPLEYIYKWYTNNDTGEKKRKAEVSFAGKTLKLEDWRNSPWSKVFTGKYYQMDGKTIVRRIYFAGDTTIENGMLELADGGSFPHDPATKINLLENGKLNITEENIMPLSPLKFVGRITGTGKISKTSDRKLELHEDNSGFTGTFTQSDGETIVEGVYFGGKSNISGKLKFLNRSSVPDGAEIRMQTGDMLQRQLAKIILDDINNRHGPPSVVLTGQIRDDGTNETMDVEIETSTQYQQLAKIDINVTNSRYSPPFVLTGQIKGNGVIDKWLKGGISIAKNNSGFTGVFTQHSDESKTRVEGVYFGGESNITGTLEFANGSSVTDSAKIRLLGNGTLNITTNGNLTFANIIEMQRHRCGIGTEKIIKTGNGRLELKGKQPENEDKDAEHINSFGGTFEQRAGEIIVSGEYGAFKTTIRGGKLKFADGIRGANKCANIELLQDGMMDIAVTDQVGSLELNCTLNGSGVINKTGSGMLEFRDKTEEFKGTFFQEKGITEMNRYFGGKTIIQGGQLTLCNYMDNRLIKSDGINVLKDGTLNIQVLNIYGHQGIILECPIYGDGKIIRTIGRGNLTLNEDMSKFTGEFIQDVQKDDESYYDYTDAKTIVTVPYFAGKSVIYIGACKFKLLMQHLQAAMCNISRISKMKE